jgi:hypothetical protein
MQPNLQSSGFQINYATRWLWLVVYPTPLPFHDTNGSDLRP